jgi:hypothetical protein
MVFSVFETVEKFDKAIPFAFVLGNEFRIVGESSHNAKLASIAIATKGKRGGSSGFVHDFDKLKGLLFHET